MDARFHAHAEAADEKRRKFADRVHAGRDRNARAAPATPGSSTLGGGGSSSSLPWDRASGTPKPPPPMPSSPLASPGTETGGRPLPPPIPAGHSTPNPVGPAIPMGPPLKACPATAFLSAASAASSNPVGAHSAPGYSTLGAGDPGRVWDGPLPGTPGPILGGVCKAASLAPTTSTSFHQPVRGKGQSNRMCMCRPKDRGLQHFPKAAYELLPESDPPMAITGPDGLGWYPNLFNSDQWYGELYPLET